MTTKVKIELVQEHMPVIILVSNGPEKLPVDRVVLSKFGDKYESYVHSGQYLIVSEMTTEELHNKLSG